MQPLTGGRSDMHPAGSMYQLCMYQTCDKCVPAMYAKDLLIPTHKVLGSPDTFELLLLSGQSGILRCR